MHPMIQKDPVDAQPDVDDDGPVAHRAMRTQLSVWTGTTYGQPRHKIPDL